MTSVMGPSQSDNLAKKCGEWCLMILKSVLHHLNSIRLSNFKSVTNVRERYAKTKYQSNIRLFLHIGKLLGTHTKSK